MIVRVGNNIEVSNLKVVMLFESFIVTRNTVANAFVMVTFLIPGTGCLRSPCLLLGVLINFMWPVN